MKMRDEVHKRLCPEVLPHRSAHGTYARPIDDQKSTQLIDISPFQPMPTHAARAASVVAHAQAPSHVSIPWHSSTGQTQCRLLNVLRLPQRTGHIRILPEKAAVQLPTPHRYQDASSTRPRDPLGHHEHHQTFLAAGSASLPVGRWGSRHPARRPSACRYHTP